ncbi:MAG: ADP-ribosylglycohydrolase family protein [Alicyclobacillaceae bacterium]|nr:ADP-ribosylglycohydrolase family protein [Alicyclobacillaceae bacterium]
MKPRSMEDRVKGGLYGVAVGDALGATVEFMSREEIRRTYGTLRDILGGGWLGLRPGEWTDDTEMTLAVAKGIAADPDHPIPHIGRAFTEWKETDPPDIGNIVRTVFRIWETAGLNHEQWHIAAERAHRELNGMSAGNGALMRTLPVGAAYRSGEDVYRRAVEIARLTHWDRKAGWTCAIYSLAVRNMIDGETDRRKAFAGAVRRAQEIAGDDFDEIGDIPLQTREQDLRPTGYTVDSFRCAVWAFFEAGDFEDAVVRAVNLGGDADTIGAITGGLAGVFWGFEAIPPRWLEKFDSEQRARLDRAAAELVKVARRK